MTVTIKMQEVVRGVNKMENMYKIERYIQHLDVEGLRQLIRFIMSEPEGKQTVINMAEEWSTMYSDDGSGYLEDD